MEREYIDQKELAGRWGLSCRTLERWRRSGDGPRFLKFKGRVLYRVADVEAFETERLRQTTGDTRPSERKAAAEAAR